MWFTDEGFYLLLVLAALAIPLLGLVAFVVVLVQRRRLRELNERLDYVTLKLGRLSEQFEAVVQAQKILAERAGATPKEAVTEPAASKEPEADEAEPAAEPEGITPPQVEAPAPSETEPVPPKAETRPPAPPERIGLEERITSRWFVWVGAVALALAGLFLVKYAIDYGLVTPRMRVAAGFVFGLALMAAGEWLRRRPIQRAIAAVKPDYVPGALVSAGLFSAYASIYAGYALFGFIAPLVAFAGLAAISLLGFLLGALHAPIVAVIGLIAGLATPALVESQSPSAIALFGYLAVIVAAATAVAAYRGWAWLLAAALAGGLGWLAVWNNVEQVHDIAVLCGFAAFLAATAMWFTLSRFGEEGPGLWSGKSPVLDELIAWGAAVAAALLTGWTLIQANDLAEAGIVLAVELLAVYVAARRFSRIDALTAVAAIAPFIVIALWPTGDMVGRAREALAGTGAALPFSGLVAPPLLLWLQIVCGLVLLALIAGFVAARGAPRPQVFAAASVLTAAEVLAVGYIPVRDVTPDRLWAGIAAALALMALGATASWNRRRDSDGERLTLGIYAVATVAALAAILAFTLRDAWLTVGLALVIPALAWIGGRLDLPEFRFVALVFATALLVRLVFNPAILAYDHDAFLGRHWVLYGYGVPAVALYAGARLFARQRDDRLIEVLDGAWLAFALIMVSLEIRILVEGAIDAPGITLFETSLHSTVWLVSAWWRGRAALAGHRFVDRWAAIVLAGLGIACVIAMQAIDLNPLVTDDSVGRWPIVNTLALAYLLPALLIVGLMWQFARYLPSWLHYAGAGLVLLLGLLWLKLEVRHAYQPGGLGMWHATSDAESWTVSAAWIASALVLFGAGIWSRIAVLRYGGLAILVVSVVKVFLIDMAGLEGLYRVASFLGLGLSLVAIGFVYQRFVQRPGDKVPES